MDMDNHGDSKNNREVRIHDSLDELSTDLADYIAELSEKSVKERGFFAIALSGGSLIGLIGYVLVSSPVLAFTQFSKGVLMWLLARIRKLCEVPYNKTVDWSRWHILWADERVVAKNHSDSNYKLAKDGFLSKVYNLSHLCSL